MNKRTRKKALLIRHIRGRALQLRWELANMRSDVEAIITSLGPEDVAVAQCQDTVNKLWNEVASLKSWKQRKERKP